MSQLTLSAAQRAGNALSPPSVRHDSLGSSPFDASTDMMTASELGFESSNPALSVWDGDDMTLDMITDVNDGDVDEDVR